jgi:ribonuclease P protein component
MLPKKNRADRKMVEKVFKTCPPNGREGKSVPAADFSFKFIFSPGLNTPKISVVVPKTISKKAVDRNSLRRKGYLALKKYLKDFPKETIGVIFFKKYQNNIVLIEDEIQKILNKIN